MILTTQLQALTQGWLRQSSQLFDLVVTNRCVNLFRDPFSHLAAQRFTAQTPCSFIPSISKQRADAVYKGVEPLTGQDIAECIVFAASRPPHVQIAHMTVFPSAQAGVTTVHRNS